MNPFPRFDPADLDPIDLIPDPVLGVDADRRITLWNRAAERTYGFTRAEALGQPASAFLLTRFPIPLLEILEAVADAGHWRGDVVHRAKDGRELTVESRWTARYDEHGNVSGGLQVDREITDPANGDTAPHGEDPVKDNRFGGAAGEFAHEFNNLLTVILNYAGLIAGELEAIERSHPDSRSAAMREDLGELEMATLRAARLIRELVAASRQEVRRPNGD